MASEDDLLPAVLSDVVLVEVIDSVKAIISAKDIDRVLVDNSDVSISRSWRDVVCADLRPFVLLDVELKEVVLPVHTVIASEDKEGVLVRYTGVE